MGLQRRPPRPAYRQGFTLVELLIVVAILSAASLLAFGAVANDHMQLRFDDTRARLQALYRAVLGPEAPLPGDAVTGFVADNGALPSDLYTLTHAATLDARSPRTPVFTPLPNSSNCTADSGATTIPITTAAAQLVKGHRGNYLGPLGTNGVVRDGWGNVAASDDALNFGWHTVLNSTDRTLSVTSLGLDNSSGGADYAADTGWTLSASDWLVPLAGWTVQVQNWRSTDIAANTLSVSLLVYVNQPGGGVWRRYATTALPCIGALGSASGACAGTVTATFIDGCKPGTSAAGTGYVPQGRHLLVLTDNGSDHTPWTADDVVSGGPTLSSATPVTAQIDATAGRNLRTVMLEVR